MHVYHHFPEAYAERLCRIEEMLGLTLSKLETIMASLTDIEPALAAIDEKVSLVKIDVDKMIALLSAIPQPGLTPEQQAAIDGAVAHATAIAASLGAIDAAAHATPFVG